jgi:hypothetical protein
MQVEIRQGSFPSLAGLKRTLNNVFIRVWSGSSFRSHCGEESPTHKLKVADCSDAMRIVGLIEPI